MNKFACSALALAAASSIGFADPATDKLDGGEWLGLDQDIVDLQLTTTDGGGTVGALIRSNYADVDDDISADTAGWSFTDVDLWTGGSVGDYDWRVSLDADGGTAALEDAYATWNASDNFDITWGQFKFGHTLSADADPEDLLFINRTVIGATHDTFDHGVMLNGDMDQFSWSVAAQNGADGGGDDYSFSARGEYHMNGGSGGMSGMEGAMGGGDDTAATIGLFWSDDEGLGDDGSQFGIDFQATMGSFSLAAEMVNNDDDLGDNEPWSLTASMMFGDDEFEAALRMEDLDTASDDTITSAALNWYQTGRNAYWGLNFVSFDGDGDSSADGTVIALGLSVGASR